MSTPTVLAIDFDDVLGGFNAAYAAYHNNTYGTNIQYHDMYTFDMHVLWGLDPDTIRRRVRTFCHEHHDQVIPIEHVGDVIPILSERYDLHLVTSRCESLRDISLEWLAAYGLDVFSDHHFTNGFGSLFPERKRTKLEVCREIGAACLIEDATINALLVADGGVPVLLPDRPWNQDLPEHPNIARVQDWLQIQTHLMSWLH